MIEMSLLILILVLLMLVCTLGVVMVAMQLPGTWVILGATAIVSWWYWEGWNDGVIGGWVLVALGSLAVIGEILEFIAGAMGARNAGASKRGAAGAIIGGILGAIIGTPTIPIPIVGTVLGAALGAGVGSILGDLWAGRKFDLALAGGKGAAIGKLWGTVAKLAIGVAMWLVVLGAALWP